VRLTEQEYRDLLTRTTTKRAKYGNKKKIVGGLVFDSTFEAQYYQELCLRVHAGDIRALQRQVPFPIVVNGFKICQFTADFVYEARIGTSDQWRRVVADCKSPATRLERGYRLVKKLMSAVHGITIEEVLKR
jgi:hypothetical protein